MSHATTKDASEAAEVTARPASDDWRFRALGREWMGTEINYRPGHVVTLTAQEVVAEPLSDEAPAPEPLSDERLLDKALSKAATDLSRDELAAFHGLWMEKDGNTPGVNLEKAKSYGRKAAEWKKKYAALRGRVGDEIASCRLAASLRKGQPEKMAIHIGAVSSLERVLKDEVVR